MCAVTDRQGALTPGVPGRGPLSPPGERGKDEFLSRFCRAAGAFTSKPSAELSSQVRGFSRHFFWGAGGMSDN
jgi:hypothetical protein